jgi:hypothetical protein
MNIFGAITILVVVFGGFLGGTASAWLLRDFSPFVRYVTVVSVALVSGYLFLRAYLWALRRLDQQAQARKGKTL